MTSVHNTRTTTGNLTSKSHIRKGWSGLDAKAVIVASDNGNVQEWIYSYLEPYAAKYYVFYQAETESDFFSLAGKPYTVMAFIEDGFFGEKTVGKLDYIRKKYPKLQLVLFSVSGLPADLAARYVSWSVGSYLSLRDSDGEIKEAMETVFRKRRFIPSYLIDSVDRYGRLPDIEPYLTFREKEIVHYTAEGKTAKEIAAALMLSKRTVDNHLANIRNKFGIRNMVGVLKAAVSKGILPVEELMTWTVQG
jgi:DNA-binding NarL/FixJ family response regulator